MQLTRRHVAIATSILLVVTGLGSFDARAQSGGITIPDGIPMHIASPTSADGPVTTARPLGALQANTGPAGSNGRFPPGLELPPGIPVHWFGGASPVATTAAPVIAASTTPSAARPSIPAGIPRHIAGGTPAPATTQPPTTTPAVTTTTTNAAPAVTTTSTASLQTTTTAPPVAPAVTTTTTTALQTTTTTAPPVAPTTTVPAPAGWYAADHTRRIELTVRTEGTVQAGDVIAIPLDTVDLVGFDATTVRVFAVEEATVTADFPAQLIDDPTHPELLLEWPGLSPAGEERNFQLYLAEPGTASTPEGPAERVQVFAGTDEGLPGFAIETESGRWFLDSDGGGFSSLDDGNGNDWIGWNEAPSDAGRFRGIPNLVFPEGHFHPGNGGATTELISSGPLGVRFRSITDDGAWAIRYDLDPRRLRMTVERAAHDYWVLYEGTPGGSLQSGQDRIVKADSTTVDGGSSFAGDLAPDDWMAITDTTNLGSLILGAVGDDTVGDRYSSLGSMAIAGLGRVGDAPALADIDRQFIAALTPTVAVGTLSRRARALVHPPERIAMSTTNRT